jgi:hypothetical protein
MALKVGGSDVDALYVGADLVDAAYLGTALVSSGGGGGGDYVAPAITISAGTSVERGDVLTGISDGPTGYLSFWVKPDAESVGVDSIKLLGGNFESRIEGPAEIQFQSYFYDQSGNHSFELRGNEPTITWGAWNHLLFAWDVGHENGERLFAVYANDVLIDVSIDYEDGDADFNIDYTAANFFALMPGNGIAPLSYADYGLWLNATSILEANGTISEVNRRKFISAAGKPVDPANWPAGSVIKFSGDQSTFLTNQGSGGAFTLVSGTLTNAATSPSD